MYPATFVPRRHTADKILLVDDDAMFLNAMERGLRLKFNLATANGAEAALAKMDTAGPFSVIITDMRMPGMNGMELLAEVQRRHPDTVRIMFTGNSEQRTAAEAINIGHIFEFLSKPCNIETVTLAVQAGIKHYHLVIAERELLEKTLKGSIKVLSDVLSAVDPLSFGHGEALGAYIRTYAQGQNLPNLWELEMAAMLSQIGMVTVPPPIIEKFRTGMKLTPPEREVIEKVPKTGADLLANIPHLDAVARIVLYQNKHYNGFGFPADAVHGEDIPIGARILKLLKDLLELEAQKLPKDTALRLLQDRRGWYDPRVLDAAFACFNVSRSDSSAKKQGQPIGVQDLQAGQIVLTDIQTESGKTLVLARSRLTPVLLLRVANFARFSPIQEPIYVEPQAEVV